MTLDTLEHSGKWSEMKWNEDPQCEVLFSPPLDRLVHWDRRDPQWFNSKYYHNAYGWCKSRSYFQLFPPFSCAVHLWNCVSVFQWDHYTKKDLSCPYLDYLNFLIHVFSLIKPALWVSTLILYLLLHTLLPGCVQGKKSSSGISFTRWCQAFIVNKVQLLWDFVTDQCWSLFPNKSLIRIVPQQPISDWFLRNIL